jgi:hypothetical protein
MNTDLDRAMDIIFRAVCQGACLSLINMVTKEELFEAFEVVKQHIRHDQSEKE